MKTKEILLDSIKWNAIEILKSNNGFNRPIINPLEEESNEVDRIIDFLIRNIQLLLPDQELEGELLMQFEAFKYCNIYDYEPTLVDIINPWDYRKLAYDIYNELLVICRWEIAQKLFNKMQKIGQILTIELARRFIRLYRLKCKEEYIDWWNAFQPNFLPENPEKFYMKER